MNQFYQTPTMLTASMNEGVSTSLNFNAVGRLSADFSCFYQVGQHTFKMSNDVKNYFPILISQPKPTFYYNFCLPLENENDKQPCSTEFETYVHMLDHTGVVFDFNVNFSYDCPTFSMSDHHLFIHPKYKQAAYSYEVLFLYDTISCEMSSLVETPFSEKVLNSKVIVNSMNAPYTFLSSRLNSSIHFVQRTLNSSLTSDLFYLVSTSKKKAQQIVSKFCHSEFDLSMPLRRGAYLNQLTQVNTTSDRFRVRFTTALSLSLVAKPLYTLLLENNKANILITQRP